MSSVKKRLLRKVGGNALAKFCSYLAKKSPEQVEVLGERLGRAFYCIGTKRRERTLSNLSFAFPDWSDAHRAKVAKQVFEHFGRSTTDFFSTAAENKDRFIESLEVVGRENVEAAFAQGAGVLMVTGHFGNFERIPAWLAMNGYPVNVVVRDADQAEVNQIVNNIRARHGGKVIARGKATRPMLEALKRNELVGIISDQNAEDIFLPFFGRPAGTNLGVGVIQERTRSAVLPATCVYLGRNRYRLQFYPLMSPLPGFEIKGEGLLRAINAWLEDVISEHPEQWLWMHDRWRNAREAGLL